MIFSNFPSEINFKINDYVKDLIFVEKHNKYMRYICYEIVFSRLHYRIKRHLNWYNKYVYGNLMENYALNMSKSIIYESEYLLELIRQMIKIKNRDIYEFEFLNILIENIKLLFMIAEIEFCY